MPRIKYYTKDGTLVPGVTTVLKEISKGEALIHWAWDLGMKDIDYRKYRDSLADVGTMVHLMILADLRNEKVNTNDFSANQISLAENSFIKYLTWKKQQQIEVLHTEISLVSEEGFGGTLDCIAKLNSKLTILDYKTSKAIYEDHWYQVGGGYSILAEQNGINIDQVKVLQIGRTEEEGFTDPTKVKESIKPYQEIFRHALGIYNIKKSLTKN